MTLEEQAHKHHLTTGHGIYHSPIYDEGDACWLWKCDSCEWEIIDRITKP